MCRLPGGKLTRVDGERQQRSGEGISDVCFANVALNVGGLR